MASSSLVPPLSATTVKLPPTAAATPAASSSRRLHHQRLSFALIPPSAKPLIKGSRLSWNRFPIAKARNEVGGLSRDDATTEVKTEEAPSDGKDVASLMSEDAISEFMAQVTSLVKLVDSRDIVELQLKQFDCEVTIHKKEALPQPPVAAPIMMMPPTAPHMAMPPPLAAAPSPSPATAPPVVAPPSAPAKLGDKVNKGKVLWIIEAMKLINDKVNKGQVLWIIEAMKLMNEIEGSRPSRNRFPVAKAQNEVGGLSRDGATTELKTKEAPPSGKDVASSMSEEAISEFMAQVRSLVKLVDSRDIVELQLKQFDCEVVIRKKEALPQPPVAAPIMMMPPAAPHMVMPPPLAAAPSPSLATSPLAAAPPSTPAKAKSSHPPLKSPMAGTFYRSPGPGLAPFVKPGDKVNKGQVLCIIEAMKLMNEIEADQAGTVVEILVEDGKPVGIEQPLFTIEP